MTTLEEVTSYNGRSPDRRRPAGPSQSTIRLYDLMASRPEGITLDEAAEHLALGFPTDQYRAYAARVRVVDSAEAVSASNNSPGRPRLVYGSPEFKRRAHRWHAGCKLAGMVKHGSARREGDLWFARRPPNVVAQGRRFAYVPGSEAAATGERVQAINTITVLRRIQRRLKSHDEIEAIDDAIRNYRRG